MPSRDYYPSNMDALAAWWANFYVQLVALATKYGIDASAVGQAEKDNLWIQYWVQARHDADNLSQQLTKYFNAISGNDETLEPPAAINWVLAGSSPQEQPPGIEFRTRKIARDIKNSMVYAVADGELLGIVGASALPPNFAGMTPEFTLETLVNFELKASFRKNGMDALKFEFRHKGGNWMPAGFLVTSPGTFAVMPTTPGTAEQVEIRAFYILKNEIVGQVSDTKTALIAP